MIWTWHRLRDIHVNLFPEVPSFGHTHESLSLICSSMYILCSLSRTRKSLRERFSGPVAGGNHGDAKGVELAARSHVQRLFLLARSRECAPQGANGSHNWWVPDSSYRLWRHADALGELRSDCNQTPTVTGSRLVVLLAGPGNKRLTTVSYIILGGHANCLRIMH